MKIRSLNLSIVAAGLVFAATVSAQKPQHPPSPEERLAKMKSDLGLSEDQVKKLKPIMEANMARMKALHEDASVPDEQKREKAREIRKAGADSIAAELTPEQKAKFEEEIKRRQKDGPPPGGPGGPPPGAGGPPPAGKGHKPDSGGTPPPAAPGN